MKVFVVDNYDSFTYNLVQLVLNSGTEVHVARNDKFQMSDIESYDKILLSPGPGVPDTAGMLKDVIKTYGTTKSILGICLGHQAIAEVYGGKIINLPKVYHGISAETTLVDKDYLFEGVSDKFMSGRYHSWSVDKALPADLKLLASDSEDQVMAMTHKTLDIKGIQFHPESILTDCGEQIIKNWLAH